ncbi:Uncharacterised protein [Chlamydia trachomatis]|nr:Uncharacterised protein [Chlamydia trachomatis]
MYDSFLSRLILPSLISFSFSSFIRSKRTDAGSSFGSCLTSLPSIAYCSIDFFNLSAKVDSSSVNFFS